MLFHLRLCFLQSKDSFLSEFALRFIVSSKSSVVCSDLKVLTTFSLKFLNSCRLGSGCLLSHLQFFSGNCKFLPMINSLILEFLEQSRNFDVVLRSETFKVTYGLSVPLDTLFDFAFICPNFFSCRSLELFQKLFSQLVKLPRLHDLGACLFKLDLLRLQLVSPALNLCEVMSFHGTLFILQRMKLRRESVISGLDVVMMTLELHGRMVGWKRWSA